MGHRVKVRVLRILYFLCFWTGLTELFYARRKRGVLILSYHSVLPDDLYDSSLHLGVSHRWSEFVQHVEVIRRRFSITTNLTRNKPGDCVISFDDGYTNNLAAAAYLRSVGGSGIFYVPVEPMLTGRAMIIDRVMMWFSYAPPGHYEVASCAFHLLLDQREEAYSQFYAWMLVHPLEWEHIPELLDHAFPFADLLVPQEMLDQRFRPMSKEEVLKLKGEGHKIGCHSWSHRPLAVLSDSDLENDFSKCATAKAQLGMDSYCYPFGGTAEVDARAILACEKFGYESAVLNIERNPFLESNAKFAHPREAIPQISDRYVIEAKLSGLESALKQLLGW
jgi:hypothetical protein